MKYSFGDKIKIITKKDECVKGVFVPSEDDSFITLKLDSGYNQSFSESNIKSHLLIESAKPNKKKEYQIKQNENLPLIKLIHIGGTIASKIDYQTGGVKAQIKPEELFQEIPELTDICRIKTKELLNILSENVRFEHFNMIAKEILNSLEDNIAGIIITHGTDTLHYTSAALSLILQNLKLPVVLVGAQRSSDRPSSDATLNLLGAVTFILDETTQKGFFVSMHSSTNDDKCTIFSGLNLRKMHSSRRDAFRQINSFPIAEVNVKEKKITYFRKSNLDSDLIDSLFEPAFFNKRIKVGILKAHPNLFPEEILNFKNFNGLIIEGTGLGNFPVSDVEVVKENKDIYSSVKTLADKIPIIMCTQCINGLTDMNVYSAGRKMKKLGVIQSGNMSPETAFIKLSWLLSNFSKEEILEVWNRNFVGECIEKTPYLDFTERN